MPLILGQLLLVPQHLIIGTTNNRGFCVVGHTAQHIVKQKGKCMLLAITKEITNPQTKMKWTSHKKVKINKIFYSLNQKSQIIRRRKKKSNKILTKTIYTFLHFYFVNAISILEFIQYLIDSAEDGVGHMIVDHDRRDEYFVEIDSVGPQSLVNRIRLVIFGRRWTTSGASFPSISACFVPATPNSPPTSRKENEGK